MLKSLRIRNYRVFKDLKVDGLQRINLIAGKNSSGKTSLLEAVFLLAQGRLPQLPAYFADRSLVLNKLLNLPNWHRHWPIVTWRLPGDTCTTLWKQSIQSLSGGASISALLRQARIRQYEH